MYGDIDMQHDILADINANIQLRQEEERNRIHTPTESDIMELVPACMELNRQEAEEAHIRLMELAKREE